LLLRSIWSASEPCALLISAKQHILHPQHLITLLGTSPLEVWSNLPLSWVSPTRAREGLLWDPLFYARRFYHLPTRGGCKCSISSCLRIQFNKPLSPTISFKLWSEHELFIGDRSTFLLEIDLTLLDPFVMFKRKIGRKVLIKKNIWSGYFSSWIRSEMFWGLVARANFQNS
jgi:hypothetical protein